MINFVREDLVNYLSAESRGDLRVLLLRDTSVVGLFESWRMIVMRLRCSLTWSMCLSMM